MEAGARIVTGVLIYLAIPLLLVAWWLFGLAVLAVRGAVRWFRAKAAVRHLLREAGQYEPAPNPYEYPGWPPS